MAARARFLLFVHRFAMVVAPLRRLLTAPNTGVPLRWAARPPDTIVRGVVGQPCSEICTVGAPARAGAPPAEVGASVQRFCAALASAAPDRLSVVLASAGPLDHLPASETKFGHVDGAVHRATASSRVFRRAASAAACIAARSSRASRAALAPMEFSSLTASCSRA